MTIRETRSPAGRRLRGAGAAVTTCLILTPFVGMAQAADIEPLPPNLCKDLGRKMSDAIRLKVATSEGPTTSVSDMAPAGQACLLSATGKGLKQTFSDAQSRMEKGLGGWAQIPEIAGGGADEVIQGYRKGDQRVVVSLGVQPPPGTCEDVPEAECKVPKKRWIWTFKAAAYRE